jgi:hypothetical protein
MGGIKALALYQAAKKRMRPRHKKEACICTVSKVVKRNGCVHLRFRTGVKDLEVMVQNIISSAFESLSRVEEGVEILDVFHHFSAREASNERTFL